MSSNLVPARRSMLGALSTDRAADRQLATIQNGAFIQRAQDEARLHLSRAKMHDFGTATHHAFEEGEGIVSDFRNRVGDDPFLAKALAPYLERGLRGIGRQLDSLDEGW